MGDFNGQIGANQIHPARGPFGIGDGNDCSEMLLDWMNDNQLIALNTIFQHRHSQLFTWCSPDGHVKTQIDFILIRKRNKKECKDCRCLVSADCGSDHQLLWAKLQGTAGVSGKSKIKK